MFMTSTKIIVNAWTYIKCYKHISQFIRLPMHNAICSQFVRVYTINNCVTEIPVQYSFTARKDASMMTPKGLRGYSLPIWGLTFLFPNLSPTDSNGKYV